MKWYDDIEKLKEGITENRLQELYDLGDEIIQRHFEDNLTIQESLIVINWIKLNTILNE